MIYLDDGICSVPSDRAESASELIKMQAGFVAHPVKQCIILSGVVVGLDIDLNATILAPKI